MLVPDKIVEENEVEQYKKLTLEKRDQAGLNDGTIQELPEFIEDADITHDDEHEDDIIDASVLKEVDAAERTISVLGQILRNYPGDIDKEQKILIIDEIYCIGMRIVEAMMYTLSIIQHDFIKFILNHVQSDAVEKQRNEIIDKTQALFGVLIADMTRSIIKKISLAYSNEALLKAVEETFSLSESTSKKIILQDLMFNGLNKPNLDSGRRLYKSLNRSDFSSIILRSIVAEYLYNNKCGNQLRNSLCSIFDLNSSASLISTYKKNAEK